jgi:hypothetical protein
MSLEAETSPPDVELVERDDVSEVAAPAVRDDALMPAPEPAPAEPPELALLLLPFCELHPAAAKASAAAAAIAINDLIGLVNSSSHNVPHSERISRRH